METISFVVLFVKNNPKNMITCENFDLFMSKCKTKWWDAQKIAIVPMKDFKDDKVNITNVKQYL